MKKLIATVMAVAMGAFAWAEGLPSSVNYDATSLTEGATDVVGYTDDMSANIFDDVTATVNWWIAGTEAKIPADDSPTVVSNDTVKGNYLKIETDTGAPLLRTFGKVYGSERTKESFSDSYAIGDHGTFIDAMVQIEGSQVVPKADTFADNKLAVWLKAIPNDDDVPGVTNLMITCGAVDENFAPTVANIAVAVEGVEVLPGSWHRITIRSIAKIPATTTKLAGFVVFIDGVAATAVSADDYAALFGGSTLTALTAEAKKFADLKQLFPSAVEADGNDQTLTAAGFDGCGGIKSVDLLTAADAPAFAKEHTFLTLKWDSHVTGITINGKNVIDGKTSPFDYDLTELFASGVAAVTATVALENGYRTNRVDGIVGTGFIADTFAINGLDVSFQLAEFTANPFAKLEINTELARDEAEVTVFDPVSQTTTELGKFIYLSDALAALKDIHPTPGADEYPIATLKLGEDVCVIDGMEFDDLEVDFVLDLNGKELKQADDANYAIYAADSTMQIIDTSVTGGGKITGNVYNGFALTIEDAEGDAPIKVDGTITYSVEESFETVITLKGGLFSDISTLAAGEFIHLGANDELCWSATATEGFYSLIDKVALTVAPIANTEIVVKDAAEAVIAAGTLVDPNEEFTAYVTAINGTCWEEDETKVYEKTESFTYATATKDDNDQVVLTIPAPLTDAVKFTITAPANTEVTKVMAGTTELTPDTDNKYTAEPGAALTVTLTALNGYVFDNTGATTKDVSATAAKDNVTIELETPAFKPAAKKGSVFFITLQDAIDAEDSEELEADNTVYVLDNIALEARVNINKDAVIDLGAKTLTSTAAGYTDTSFLVKIANDADVTIKNGAVAATAAAKPNCGIWVDGGELDLVDVDVTAPLTAVQVTKTSALTVDADSVVTGTGDDSAIFINTQNGDTTIEDPSTITIAGTVQNTYATAATADSMNYAISTFGNDKAGANVTIANGAVVSSTTLTAIYFPSAGTLTVNGGTITGCEFGIYAKSGTVTINDGEITATTTTVVPVSVDNDGYTGAGYAVCLETGSEQGGYANNLSFAVYGGKFTSEGAAVYNFVREGADPIAPGITAGAFKAMPDVSLIVTTAGQSAKWVLNEETGYYEPDFDTIMIAKNLTTDEPYAWGQLQTAIDEATSGDTIQMIADYTFEFSGYSGVVVPADKAITLDLNGKKIFAKSVESSHDHRVFYVSEGGNFTITDGATGGEIEYYETMPSDFSHGSYIVCNKGTFTLAGGKLTGYAKCKGMVYGEPCWGIISLVLNDVNSNKDDQPVVFNMLGGELNVWAHGETLEDPNKPGSTYPEYNGISGIAINQYDASDDNIINISGGVIKGGTLRSAFNNPYKNAAVKSAVVLNITGGTFEGRFDIDNYGATEVNIKNAKIVSNADGAFEPWFRAAGTAANQPYVTIDAATVEASSLRFPMAFNAANIEVVGGLFDQKEKVTYATTPYYYSASTITEDVVALKDLVPEVVCTITDNETAPATYTVAKVPAALEIVKATGVASVTYTVNDVAAGENQTVVYGDVVKITGITYADGYKAGDVEVGAEYEMDAATMTAAITGETSVKIDVDATKYPVKKGLLFFLTLQEALDAEGTDDIVLCDNIAADGVEVAAAAAIDMAGYTLTVSEGATLTLGDAVTLKNSVAGQGGFLNAGTIAISADQDFSNLAWGAGGFIDAGAGTSAKLAIAADATVKMPTATVDLDPNQMATVTPGFWDGTATGAKVFAAANMWKYNGATWDAAVATVNDAYFFTVADALAAVQAAEQTGDVTVVALGGLTITVGEEDAQQSITLAKGDTITVTTDGWSFTGAPVITKVFLVAGKKIVVPAAIDGYATKILPGTEGYTVVEKAVTDGYEYSLEKVRTFFGGGDGSEATPYIIAEYQHLVDLQDWVAAGNATAGVYFKQTEDIDFADIDGKGTAAPAWAGIGDLNGSGKCFNGNYDGYNKTIDNVVFKAQKYGGFFNSMIGGSIKNLTIDAAGVEDFAGASDIGIGVFCGYLKKGGVIDGCTVTGFLGTETAPLTHNAAGFVNHYDGNCEKTTPGAGDPSAIKNSTSSIVIYTNKKGAGFAAHGGNSGSCYDDVVLFENCVFNGTINFCAGGEGANKSMAAQFMGYATNAKTHFVNCVAAGTIVLADGVASDADGALIGQWQDSDIAAEGCIIKAGDKSIGKVNTKANAYTGFTYAVPSTDETYGDGYVALVAEDDLVLDGTVTYKVMADGAALELDAGESITLDETLATATITTVEGYFVDYDETTGTYTSKALPTFSVDKTAVGDTAVVTVKVNNEDVTENIPATLEVDDTYLVTSVAATDYTYEGVKLDEGWTLSEDNTTITFQGTAEAEDEISITVPAAVEASSDPIPPVVPKDDGEVAKILGDLVDGDALKAIVKTPEQYTAFQTWAHTVDGGSAAVALSPNAAVSFELSPIVATATLFENEPAVKFTAIAQSGTDWNATLQIKDGATGEEVQLAVEEAAAAYANFVKVGTEVGSITQAATITATAADTVDGKQVILTVTPPTGDKGFIKFTTAK